SDHDAPGQPRPRDPVEPQALVPEEQGRPTDRRSNELSGIAPGDLLGVPWAEARARVAWIRVEQPAERGEHLVVEQVDHEVGALNREAAVGFGERDAVDYAQKARLAPDVEPDRRIVEAVEQRVLREESPGALDRRPP